MRCGVALRHPVLVEGGKRRDVADTRGWSRIGRTRQLAHAPRHVFAGKRYRRGRLAERARSCELHLASRRGRIDLYALELTTAAAT
jgi:hypothetical protein